jgi:hypothetical protein
MPENKALINFYVRLIQRGQKTIDEIPEKYKKVVEEELRDAPPLELTEEESKPDPSLK